MTEENHTVIREVSQGATAGAMPYILIVGALGVGYLLLKDDLNNTFGGLSESAGSVIERVTETVTTVTDTVKEVYDNTVEKVTEVNNTIKETTAGTPKVDFTYDGGTYTDPNTGKTTDLPDQNMSKSKLVKSSGALPAGTNIITKTEELGNYGTTNTTRYQDVDLSGFNKAAWVISPVTGEKVYLNTNATAANTPSMVSVDAANKQTAAALSAAKSGTLAAQLTAAIQAGAVDNSSAKASSSKTPAKTPTAVPTQSAKADYKQGTTTKFTGSSKTSSGGGASLKGKKGVVGVKY